MPFFPNSWLRLFEFVSWEICPSFISAHNPQPLEPIFAVTLSGHVFLFERCPEDPNAEIINIPCPMLYWDDFFGDIFRLQWFAYNLWQISKSFLEELCYRKRHALLVVHAGVHRQIPTLSHFSLSQHVFFPFCTAAIERLYRHGFGLRKLHHRPWEVTKDPGRLTIQTRRCWRCCKDAEIVIIGTALPMFPFSMLFLVTKAWWLWFVHRRSVEKKQKQVI